MQLLPQGFVPAPQEYEQVCVPVSHWPTCPAVGAQSPSLQQAALAMHEAPQIFILVGQEYLQSWLPESHWAI
jgi:hypothetical protein